jgi:hypothetical protein
MKKSIIKQYSIARCSLGVLGIITSKTPADVTYSDGSHGIAWTGISLENVSIDAMNNFTGKQINIKAGDLWCSKMPTFISDYDSNIIPSCVLESLNL